CGGTNGSIAFTTTLADGTYTLNYNDGAAKTASVTVASGAFTLSGLIAGSYSSFSITVTGCTSSASGSTTLSDPSTATLTLGSAVNPTTCGGTNGSIAFTTTLADGTYTLNYSDGAAKNASVMVASGAFTLSGLPAGSYSSFSITVSSCTSSASGSTTLSDPSTATLTLGFPVNPTTCGGTNGSIAFTTTLADGSYTLNYSDGAAKTASVTVASGAFTLSGLPAGSYSSFSITVSSCTSSASGSRNLTDPTTATLTLGSAVNPSTCGGTNGSIPFTTTLADGTYTLNYNDGAAKTASVTVASGAFTLSGLTAGTYNSFSITVTGCISSASGSRTLTDPTTATLTLGSAVNPTTCGGTNGSIAFTTTLADGTYTLNYSDGAAKTASVTVASGAFTLSGLVAGSYSGFSITVNSCTSSASGSRNLTDPSTATLTLGSSVNPSTCGGTNGSIAFTTTLADGTYTLNYSDGAAKTASVTVASGAFTLSGLPAGSYSSFSITVSSCTSSASGSRNLTDPSTATLTLGSAVNPTTCGGTNGSIAFTTTLADGTYTLNYNDGAAKTASVTVASGAFTLSGLIAGSYSSFSITVSSCTSSASGSKTLTDPSAPTLTPGVATPVTLYGGSDGSIAFTTTVSNGSHTLNYSFGGSPASASVTVASGAFTLTGLAAGSYTAFSITVSGCNATAAGPVVVASPATHTLAAGSSVNPSVCSAVNGSISFTSVNLPDGSYTLDYLKGGSPASASVSITSGAFTLSGLSAGSYSNFTITFNTYTNSPAGPVTLTDPAAHTLAVNSFSSPNTCGSSNGSITFLTSGLSNGTYSLSYTGSGSPQNVTVSGNSFTLSGLPGGTYSGFSINNGGCVGSVSTPVTLSNPSAPVASVYADGPANFCKGSSVNLIASAGDSYLWNTGETTRVYNASVTGTYIVTVFYAGGCSSTASITVSATKCNTAPVAVCNSFTVPAGPNCTASVTPFRVGSESYDVDGDPLTYSLSPAGPFSAGTHQVTMTVKDPFGASSSCTTTFHVVDETLPTVRTKNISVTLNAAGQATISPGDINNGSFDNCGIGSMKISQNVFGCNDLGTKQVALYITDIHGHTSEGYALVTVSDKTAPVAKVKNISVKLDASGKVSIKAADINDGSSDNCSITELSLSRTDFDCTSAGPNNVTLTVKDAGGNTASAVAVVTIIDDIAPVALAKNLTVYLDKTGLANITAQMADNGSSDNCGIKSLIVSNTSFICSDLRVKTVSLTVTDKSDNKTSVNFSVTVLDTIAPVVVTKAVTLELSAEKTASLTAAQLNGGSSDNCGIVETTISKTAFSCSSLGVNKVRLTVKDASGNTSSALQEVIVTDPLGVCPCSYAVIAFDKVTLNRNKVNTGGVGIINSGKKVKLIKTLVNATGTFVKADGKDFDSESSASSYMKGLAPTPDPFRENTFNDKKKLKVKKGQSVSANEDHYGNVKVGRDATLTFSSKSDVFIKKLSLKKGAKIVFGQQTFLVISKKMSIGKEVIINEAAQDAKIFTGKNTVISKGAQVHASIHSDRNMTLRRSSEDTPTQMYGLFVADKIKSGRHVQWNGTGTGCDDNKEQDQAVLARKARKSGEKKEITEPEKQLITEEIVSLELSAGPNPTNDLLDLLIRLPKETSAQLHVTDLNGRNLFSEQIQGSGKTIRKQLSLGKFASGTYLLNLRTPQENKTVRIVKID
ncbi:T9SS type A sorting domain-containing protein, partial [Emticicia sp. CRIBPO]|uniref:T9SS type A sorting domain-containing protein n=1 Tax=Emticicia sp. CRIBPO TaxID=2683258 RepID=UPI00141251D3